MGEPGVSEFGNYEHGSKYGLWYKIDHSGDLLSIENFRNNVLDGEVKYYDQGRLYCIGHYRGLNPRNKFDTIVVMHPVTQEEQYKVISTDQGALRHGTWQYFDPANGYLVKEEEYQVDELVFRKDYDVAGGADSLARKRHEAQMPHNKKKKALPPAGKKLSYTEH
jgi:antitoxin component YwqK of YwqJK toxin-antitoxin module